LDYFVTWAPLLKIETQSFIILEIMGNNTSAEYNLGLPVEILVSIAEYATGPAQLEHRCSVDKRILSASQTCKYLAPISYTEETPLGNFVKAEKTILYCKGCSVRKFKFQGDNIDSPWQHEKADILFDYCGKSYVIHPEANRPNVIVCEDTLVDPSFEEESNDDLDNNDLDNYDGSSDDELSNNDCSNESPVETYDFDFECVDKKTKLPLDCPAVILVDMFITWKEQAGGLDYKFEITSELSWDFRFKGC